MDKEKNEQIIKHKLYLDKSVLIGLIIVGCFVLSGVAYYTSKEFICLIFPVIAIPLLIKNISE